MSLKAKVIGLGAAGNKAAITLIEEKVVDPKQVVLLNTTLKEAKKFKHLNEQYNKQNEDQFINDLLNNI